MIKVKGKVVTFTGKDAKQLQNLADSLGKTSQETVELAIRAHMDRLNRSSSFVYESENTSESTIKPTKKTTKRSK